MIWYSPLIVLRWCSCRGDDSALIPYCLLLFLLIICNLSLLATMSVGVSNGSACWWYRDRTLAANKHEQDVVCFKTKLPAKGTFIYWHEPQIDRFNQWFSKIRSKNKKGKLPTYIIIHSSFMSARGHVNSTILFDALTLMGIWIHCGI